VSHTAEQHVVLITHTPRHLERSLAGFAHQTLKPTTITVSCDTDDPALREAVSRAVRMHGVQVMLVRRAHTGQARVAQVRNNAVRALLAGRDLGCVPATGSRLILIDGDTCPSPRCVELHARLGGARGLVSTFRVNLSEAQTKAFDDEALRAGREPVTPTPEQLRELASRQRRYQRQRLLRRLGLGKAHKPRLIGGHASVPFDAYVSVNGVDEGYTGYGQEDDDFARRLHRAGWPTVVAVNDIRVYHLYHPTRAPVDWHHAPGVERFRAGGPVRCVLGLDNPSPQPDPVVEVIE
jgi:N-terminal domain of galactosyltransferase